MPELVQGNLFELKKEKHLRDWISDVEMIKEQFKQAQGHRCQDC